MRWKVCEPVAKVVVDVMPKRAILDPQGQAVAGALGRQPVATRLLLSTATPVNQDFVLMPHQQTIAGRTGGHRTIAPDHRAAGHPR